MNRGGPSDETVKIKGPCHRRIKVSLLSVKDIHVSVNFATVHPLYMSGRLLCELRNEFIFWLGDGVSPEKK
jgi:hypothetical protein